MSEESSAEDRTEQPSEKRLKEAREKGDVPRSRDLSGALVVLAGVAALMAGAPAAMARARTIYGLGLHYSREALFSGALPGRVLHEAISEALLLFAPVAIATLLAALAGPVLLGGLNFSAEALQPKFERLDPIAGLGRIFAMRGLVELGKSLLKLALIGSALALLLRHWENDLMATGRGAVGVGIVRALELLNRDDAAGLDRVAQWDQINGLLQLLMTRWEVRGRFPPLSTQIALNDVEKSLTAAEQSMATLSKIAPEAGIASNDCENRCLVLEKSLVRPLETYRGRLLPHEVNEARKRQMAERIIRACGGSVAGKTIAVLGLTFKPNTDDMRDSASLVVVPALRAAGATVRAFDPEGMGEAKKLLADLAYCTSAYEAMEGAHAVVIITEWNEFRALDLEKVKALLVTPTVVDLRNIYKPEDMAEAGFFYFSIGRPSVEPAQAQHRLKAKG